MAFERASDHPGGTKTRTVESGVGSRDWGEDIGDRPRSRVGRQRMCVRQRRERERNLGLGFGHPFCAEGGKGEGWTVGICRRRRDSGL